MKKREISEKVTRKKSGAAALPVGLEGRRAAPKWERTEEKTKGETSF
jgi:hypothetical protein